MKCHLQLTACFTLLRKEMYRVLRIWPQTLMPSVITMSLYFFIFGHLLGLRLGDMHGVPYMAYLAPGLIMMAVINNAYTNVSASFFGVKFSRSLEEMLVSPMHPLAIIFGFVGGGVLRGLIVGGLVALVACFFTDLQVHHVWIMVSVVLLTAMLFSLAGLLNAFFAKKFDDVMIVPTFILTPLTYLGGVFYAVSQLPPFWRHVSMANPVLYMVNAFRYGVLGVADIPVVLAMGLILACVLGLFAACWWCLHAGKGLRS